MQETPAPKIKKLPFWIADGALLCAAFVLAFTGEPGMSPMEAFWMVVCVVLGAGVLVSAYSIEYMTQARLHRSDHDQASWERVRKLDQSLVALGELRQQLEGLSEKDESESTVEALTGLETRLGVMERHIADLNERSSGNLRSVTQKVAEQQSSNRESIDALAAELSKLGEKLDSQEGSQGSDGTQAALEALQGSVQAQQGRLDEFSKVLSEISEADVDLVPVLTKLESLETALEAERDARSKEPAGTPRSQYGRSSLLSKAFGSNPPQDSSAVMERILKPEDKAAASEDKAATPSSDEADIAEPEPQDSDEEADEDEAEVLLDEALEEEEQTAAMPPAKEPKEMADAPSSLAPVAPLPEFSPKGEQEEPDDLWLELDKPPLSEALEASTADSLGQTRLTVHALIGIGNKPYVRGDGPGLSWERGTPMEFVEIGKWEWKTMRAREPFKYQVWFNDQKPAEGEPITAQPGAHASVTPRFPA